MKTPGQICVEINNQEVTPAMRRGTELEPAARAAYERLAGHIMELLVMVDGEYGASLDGIALEGDLILGRGRLVT